MFYIVSHGSVAGLLGSSPAGPLYAVGCWLGLSSLEGSTGMDVPAARSHGRRLFWLSSGNTAGISTERLHVGSLYGLG